MPTYSNVFSSSDLHLLRREAKERIGIEVLYLALKNEATNFGRSYAPGILSLVAIIDSGLNYHNEISPDRIVACYDAVDETGSIRDETGHGTAIAGIIGGTGSPDGHSGLAPAVEFIIVKVGAPPLSDWESSGSIPTFFITKALQWIDDKRTLIEAKTGRHLGAVCLATAGGPIAISPDPGWAITPTGIVIRKLSTFGVPIVVGSGNTFADGQGEGMHWPAILPKCISIGSTYDADYCSTKYGVKGKIDEIAFYSNRTLTGEYQTTLFAPGSIITSISNANPNGPADIEGTSAATPVACGAILLLQELYFMRNGAWPSTEFTSNILKETATRLVDSKTNKPYRLLSLSNIAKTF